MAQFPSDASTITGPPQTVPFSVATNGTFSVEAGCGRTARGKVLASRALAASASGASIPAGAGEPRSGKARRCFRTAMRPRARTPRKVRTGHHSWRRTSEASMRSIPRVRRTAPAVIENERILAGLSPRVRGNHDGGEPVRPTEKVYPRGCGGTSAKVNGPSTCWGLSPRVRGNPTLANPDRWPGGSIPAGAGGTQKAGGIIEETLGLSPRVRGNRQSSMGSFSALRSIPAGAGEPRWPPEGQERRSGSIPAGAGEPSPARPARPWSWVYPRGCGGTMLFYAEDGEASGSIPAGAGEP